MCVSWLMSCENVVYFKDTRDNHPLIGWFLIPGAQKYILTRLTFKKFISTELV